MATNITKIVPKSRSEYKQRTEVKGDERIIINATEFITPDSIAKRAKVEAFVDGVLVTTTNPFTATASTMSVKAENGKTYTFAGLVTTKTYIGYVWNTASGEERIALNVSDLSEELSTQDVYLSEEEFDALEVKDESKTYYVYED